MNILNSMIIDATPHDNSTCDCESCLTSLQDFTQPVATVDVIKVHNVSDSMATGIARDAQALSAGQSGVAMVTQEGKGNSGWGLDSGQSITAISQSGKEGANIPVRDIFAAQGLLWDYVEKDIPQALDGFAVNPNTPRSKALYRDTDGQFMGAVGGNYNTEMSPAETCDALQKALDVANEQATQEIIPERVLVFKDGAEHALQTTTGVWETPRGKLQGRMLAGTGYAGSKPFFFNITNTLAVCQNTYLHAQMGATMIRHTKNMAEKIELAILSFLSGQRATEQSVQWMKRVDRVAITLDQMANHFAPLMFRSRDVSVSDAGIVTLDKTANVPNQTNDKREALINAFEDSDNGAEGRSLLDVAQALTYVTSHWSEVSTPRTRSGGKAPLSNDEQTLRGAASDAQAQGWNVLAAASVGAEIEADDMAFMGIDFGNLSL